MSPASDEDFDEVVHEGVDPRRAGRAQNRQLVVWEVALREDAVAKRVVDVVVDVGDPVDDADDLALERLRQAVACVGEDPVDHLVREVQSAGDARGLLVVAEPVAAGRAQQLVENGFAGVAEGRVPHVVAEADRLGQILVQPKRARHDARDARRLEGVGHARAVVVACRVDEDLRLSLQAAERLRVDDAVAVALKRRADAALLLGALAAAALVRAHGEGRQGVAPPARASAQQRRRQRFRPAPACGQGSRSGGGDDPVATAAWPNRTEPAWTRREPPRPVSDTRTKPSRTIHIRFCASGCVVSGTRAWVSTDRGWV